METDQHSKECKWAAKHEKRSTLINITTVVTAIFEDVIDTAYHLDGMAIAKHGFGLMEPQIILVHLQWLYGKSGYQDIRLNLS